eukprot:jgi/Chlat1/1182/Chrsp114S08651
MFVFSNVGGVVADHLIVHKHYNVGYTRKLLNTIRFDASAAALLLMPMATTSGTAVAYATVTLAMCALARGGFSVNHMDIAPRQAGVLLAQSNTPGTLASSASHSRASCSQPAMLLMLIQRILRGIGSASSRSPRCMAWRVRGLLQLELGRQGGIATDGSIHRLAASGNRLYCYG